MRQVLGPRKKPNFKAIIYMKNTNIIWILLFQESVRKRTNEFSLYFTVNTTKAVSTENKTKQLGNSSSLLVMYYVIVSLVFVADFLLALYIVLFLYSKCSNWKYRTLYIDYFHMKIQINWKKPLLENKILHFVIFIHQCLLILIITINYFIKYIYIIDIRIVAMNFKLSKRPRDLSNNSHNFYLYPVSSLVSK